MLKVLAAVLAVLSAAISITIYTATLPALEKLANDNAAAIEENAEDIGEFQEQIKPKYLHTLVNSSYKIICYVKNNNAEAFTDTTLLDYINSTPEKCLINYYATSLSTTETPSSTYLILYVIPPRAGGAKFGGAIFGTNLSGSTTVSLVWGYSGIYKSFTDTVTEI